MPSLTQSRRQLILVNAPATPQISLPSRSGHITLRCCNFLTQLIFCDHPSALRRLPQWNFVLLAVKSPERMRANSPIEFLHDFLFPSPRASDTVYFRLDDILHTAASNSEDFEPALADALPPSGQEARPSAAYSELVDVLSLRHREARAGLARWPPRVPSFESRQAVSQWCTFQAWKEEAAIFQRSASWDRRILEAAIFLPPY